MTLSLPDFQKNVGNPFLHLLSLTLFFHLFLFGPTHAAAETKKPTVQKIEIALNWKAEPQFGGFYRAFLKRDMPFKLLEGGSGTPTIQMLAFGKINYAIVSAEEILISNERNPQNTIIALFAVFQKNPQALITQKQRGLNSISEIMNQPGIIAAQSGLTYVQYLKNKYPQNKVKWVPYPGGITGLIAEKNYTQQGFATSEPLLAEKKNIPVSTFLVADEGFNPYTTVLAVRRAYLEENKSEVLQVVSAVKKGWQEYLNNPLPTNKFMATLNKSLDAATFAASAEAQKSLIVIQNPSKETASTDHVGQMTQTRWQSLIDSLIKLKVLKKTLRAEDQFSSP